MSGIDDVTTNFTPREIVSELNRYIIGQDDAKRSVAIAIRNRWRRRQVPENLRDEIAPKNIIMIGPTGVGKTEIARRLSKLVRAPFVKVEASKFTEVGYVGKDVESMIRELTDLAVKMVREEEMAKIRVRAEEMAEERLLDLLLPVQQPPTETIVSSSYDVTSAEGDAPQPEPAPQPQPQPEEKKADTREKLRKMLRKGKLDDRMIELAPPQPRGMPMVEVVAAGGVEEMGMNLKEMFGGLFGGEKKKRKVKVPEALKLLQEEEAAKLVDMDNVSNLAVERVEQMGIVFLDEIDKIAGKETGHGPDVSRQGVQRDILPIVEGSTVMTKYGMVKTDHVLFIAAGAFHLSKPSDLIPELQGRFPIRVELKALTEEDFLRIIAEPENSLTKQYMALMEAEKVKLVLTDDAIQEICKLAVEINEQTENIGARRLYTVMENVLDEISFEAPERSGETFTVDAVYVQKKLSEIVKNRDLSRYVL